MPCPIPTIIFQKAIKITAQKLGPNNIFKTKKTKKTFFLQRHVVRQIDLFHRGIQRRAGKR